MNLARNIGKGRDFWGGLMSRLNQIERKTVCATEMEKYWSHETTFVN